MNATQTAILDLIAGDVTARRTKDLQDLTGKSETTVRKALKELVAEGLVVKNPDGVWVAVQPKDDEQPVTRRYRRHDKPTTRTVRTNQITKCEVAVVRTDEDEATAKKHGITAKWMTVCQTHDHAVGTDKVLDAHWFSSYPLFCDEVRKLVQAAVGRRRANPTSSPEAAKRWMPKAS